MVKVSTRWLQCGGKDSYYLRTEVFTDSLQIGLGYMQMLTRIMNEIIYGKYEQGQLLIPQLKVHDGSYVDLIKFPKVKGKTKEQFKALADAVKTAKQRAIDQELNPIDYF